MRTPCGRCGGAKRGTGQGYCPKPECRAAVATAKAEARAAAAKAKAAAKPKADVKPKRMPMKRPAAAGAVVAAVPKAKAKVMMEPAVRKRPRSASLPDVGLGLAIAEAVADESEDINEEIGLAEAVDDDHDGAEDANVDVYGAPSSSKAGHPCTFSIRQPDAAATFVAAPGRTQCVLCSDSRLKDCLGTRTNLRRFVAHLKDLRDNNADQLEAAFARIGDAAGADAVLTMRAAVDKPARKRPAAAKRGAPAKPKSLAEQWHGLLSHRKVMTAEPTALEKADYAGWKRDDERRRNKKFPGVFEQAAAAVAEAAPDDDEEEDEVDWQTPLAKGTLNPKP